LRRPLPISTQNLSDLGIIYGRFPWSFVSYPFGLPCAVCKAFAPVPVTQHYSVIPFPLVPSSSYKGRCYRALRLVLISAFTSHLWNIPWSVSDARRSVQNILIPNRVQKYS
ncbi:hypothetical protein LAZ44_30395, partial [Vibrio alginolyticus]|uniref:hypothetical protein n=1 Tax=Vibrio TaxID=662 RepID=UPI001CDCEB5D